MPSQDAQFNSKVPNPDWPGVDDIDPTELWQNREQTVIVDVRRPDEFTGELGHIPGAKLVVLDTLPESLDQLPKDRPIVFVCRSGARSGRAASFAKSKGWTNCFNMKGGMILWNQLNLLTEGKPNT